ncbi:MAG: GAF domain-containing protein, partial [Deltaproteobacteria bacterium]|nr:GAF domain-containing protein [Deltaproteobacteria bacterium]
MQRSIDKVFFRGRYDYQGLLKEISGEMASLLKFNEIKDLLFTSITHALHVTHICLIVYDDTEGHFRVYSDDAELQGDTGTHVFDQRHSLISFLEKHGRPLSKYIVEKMTTPEDESDRIFSVFDTLRASMIVPMISHTRLIGMIALGQKKSGELFVHEDLELLTTIANQSVIALENAKSYEEIEKLNRDLEKKVEERTAALRQALEEKE